MYWVGGLIVIVFIIPNTTNFKEREAFSDKVRLEEAARIYHTDSVGDAVTVAAGPYYKRGKFVTFFLGEKQRELWTTPVEVPVFRYKSFKGGLTPKKPGGGDQTISIKLEDSQERKWALRSVNKDQKSALPGVLRITALRFLFRDQVASANPFGHLVIPVLSDAIGVHHTTPQLVFVAYDEEYKEYNERMAGRMAYLEEDLSNSWKNSKRFGPAAKIVNTEDMLAMQEEGPIPLDTALYLKSRLFDILISDWDRHEGNWEWALAKEKDGNVFEAIPKDRDNAFYQFDEGLLSHIGLLFVPKFQSFRKDYGKISGLMRQARNMDKPFLSKMNEEDFLEAARAIQSSLTDEVITSAFRKYPPVIYDKKGKEHEEILKARLAKLPEAAKEFHKLLNN